MADTCEAGPVPRLALFDLDKTLTREDSYFLFLGDCLRRWPSRLLRLPLLVIPSIAFLLRFTDRGGLKGSLMRALIGGLPRAALDEEARKFARRLVRDGLHTEAPAVLEAHRRAGDAIVVMSASPDLYVPHVAHELGADAVECSAIRWSGDRLDGRLDGPNCRGAEKTRRLAELRRRFPGRAVIGYGNSSSDIDHLRHCEERVYVNASGERAKALAEEGFTLVRWH
jgi:phosphatidylglycerophosphatase C